jgi:hypothetical protein
VRRGSATDQIVRIVGLIGYSVRSIGLLGLVLFYAKLQWVAFPGRLDVVYINPIFTPITGFLLTRCGAVRRLLECLPPHHPAGSCSATFRSYQPGDALGSGSTAQEYIVAARPRACRNVSSGAMHCAMPRCRWSP